MFDVLMCWSADVLMKPFFNAAALKKAFNPVGA
jgi:hypothetical protein